MPRDKAYYWAQGKKIPLEYTPQIAVDVPAATRADLWNGELATAATDLGAQVTEDLMLVPATELSRTLRDRLEEASAVQPVFRHDDTLLVALPEVRVETRDPAEAAALWSAVKDWGSDVVVEQPKPGRFVLKPTSRLGQEALELANYVSERVKPDAAQARFVRVVADSAGPIDPSSA